MEFASVLRSGRGYGRVRDGVMVRARVIGLRVSQRCCVQVLRPSGQDGAICFLEPVAQCLRR